MRDAAVRLRDFAWLAGRKPFDVATHERIAGAPRNDFAMSHPGMPGLLSALVRIPCAASPP